LVPVGDALFFSQYAACLNLGGFANISFQEDGLRKAFDICPVNSVLNALSHQIGLKYDDRGRVAASGKYSTPLLDALNSASFFRKNPPKSLGVEFVEAEVMPLMHATKIETEHLLCTYVEHVAFQISRVLSYLGSSRVLVTGGGAYNRFLMERIQAHTSASLVLPSPELIECKEALIFALLGLLRLEKTPNCLKSVTGASKDHSSGKIALP
jgi:anhydro-N-acetylmuramic acid kinase